MEEKHDDAEEHPIVAQTRVPPEDSEHDPSTKNDTGVDHPIVTQTRVP